MDNGAKYEKLLLRPDEVAQMLGISRSGVYLMICRGEIPGAIRMGRSVRVSADSLRRWIAERTK